MAAANSTSIKKTQDMLGKYVTKPPLTEKLLSKPPFRFLHDVISAVIRDTGALQGLYTDAESKSENVKDKDGKIRYLEKAVDCISFALGENLGAKPGKIVSGQESSKTNELLQALARIIENSIDTQSSVERVLKGEKPDKTNNKPSVNKRNNNNHTRESSRSAERNEQNNRNNNGGGSRRGSLSNKDSRSNSRGRDKTSPGRSTTKDNKKNNLSRSNSIEESKAKKVDPINGDTNHGLDPVPEGVGENGFNNQGDSSKIETATAEEKEPLVVEKQKNNDEVKETNSSTSALTKRRSSVTSKNSKTDSSSSRPHTGYGKNRTENDETSGQVKVLGDDGDSPKQAPGNSRAARPTTGRMKSARPPSARPAAPRLRDKTDLVQDDQVQARPQTGKVANVIVDGDGDTDDADAAEFLIEETPKDNLDLTTVNSTSMDADTAVVETGGQDHGALVQQILVTKKELEVGQKSDEKKTVEIEREAGLSDLSRRREREATQREVGKLRESIQTLTRSANPLGKLMDFLQEDVDSMQRELDHWKDENRRLKANLMKEENQTEESIEPLKVHLADLEVAVQEQLDNISIVKSNIMKNDEKIARMIASIGFISQ